jgi:hypothetical protein
MATGKPTTAESSLAPIGATALVILMLVGLLAWGASAAGLLHFGAGADEDETSEAASGDLLARKPATLLCELRASIPLEGFDSHRRESRINLLAGIDIRGRTGWYDGQYSLSETRKGTLTIDGHLLRVGRAALYERHGAMVSREEFTLDRRTGEFVQALELRDGRRYELIRGYCGVLTRAPF